MRWFLEDWEQRLDSSSTSDIPGPVPGCQDLDLYLDTRSLNINIYLTAKITGVALVLKNNNCNLAKSGRSKITAVMMSQFIGFLLNNNNNYVLA